MEIATTQIFVGEFNEDEVKNKSQFYLEMLNSQIKKHNLSKYSIRTHLVEHKGFAYYFRKMKVWLIPE